MRQRQARQLRGQRTLLEIATATGVDFSALSRFERMERTLGYHDLKRLAEFYGCTIDDLLREVPDAQPAEVAKVNGGTQ